MDPNEMRHKSRKPRKRKPAFNPDDFTFVNVYLDTADKKALEAEELNDSDLWSFISRFVEEEYKFSLSCDAEHDRFIAALTGRKPGSDNFNRCVSASAATPDRAVQALRYKVLHKLPLDAPWAPYEDRESSDFR